MKATLKFIPKGKIDTKLWYLTDQPLPEARPSLMIKKCYFILTQWTARNEQSRIIRIITILFPEAHSYSCQKQAQHPGSRDSFIKSKEAFLTYRHKCKALFVFKKKKERKGNWSGCNLGEYSWLTNWYETTWCKGYSSLQPIILPQPK